MEPVGLMTRPPDFIGTLSGLMGLKQQQQALQGGAAEVQMKQQDARQRAALAKVDWNKWMGDDGTLSTDKMIADKDTLSSLGDLAPQVIQQGIQIKAGHLANKESLLKLTDDQRKTWASIAGGLKNDPDVKSGTDQGKRKVKDAFTQFAQAYGMDAAKAVAPFALPVMNDQVPADKLSSMLEHVQMQTLDTQKQLDLTKSQPQFVQGPKGLQGIETNQYAGPPGTKVGPPVEQGVAPQAVTSPTTGGTYIMSPGGTVKPVTESGKGKGPGFNPNYQGQAQDVETFRNEVNQTRQAGDQVPLARNINHQILQLSSNAKTGPGSQAWQHVLGAVGAPFGLSPTASYQEVGKFLEKNAIANMQSMGGPPSDARLSAAAAANGSTQFSPEALQKVTKFNDATTTALAQYRQGIDHAVGMGISANYLELPKFKSEWAKNFDVNVFRVENAIRDGDTAELAQIKKELGPKGLKELADKRKRLTELANGQ